MDVGKKRYPRVYEHLIPTHLLLDVGHPNPVPIGFQRFCTYVNTSAITQTKKCSFPIG